MTNDNESQFEDGNGKVGDGLKDKQQSKARHLNHIVIKETGSLGNSSAVELNKRDTVEEKVPG